MVVTKKRNTLLTIITIFILIIFGCGSSSSKERNSEAVSRQNLEYDISGYWVFENYTILGESDNSDFEYEIIQRHKGDVFLFKNDTLFIQSEDCFYKIDVFKTKTINHLHSKNTVELYQNVLSKGFNVHLDDSITLIVNYNEGVDEGCPYPYQQLFFIDDKLFIVEDLVVIGFVPSNTPPEVKEEFNIVELCAKEEVCECEEGGSMEEGYYTQCKFYNMSSINELYEFVILKNGLSEILKEAIPKENIKYSIENSEVEYIVDKGNLTIRIEYEGGMEELHFIENEDFVTYELIQDVD